MSATQSQTLSFLAELYDGVHVLSTDELWLALYDANATLGPDTTEYSTDNEVTGTGYTAGGALVTGVTISTDSAGAFVSFDNVTWDPAEFTARCALLYNKTKDNRAILVLDFGADRTATSDFTVTMPPATITQALLRSMLYQSLT